MSDAQDELVFLPHAVHKLHRDHARVIRLGKLFRCPVKSTTETITLNQKSKESTVITLATNQNTIFKLGKGGKSISKEEAVMKRYRLVLLYSASN